jgi:2-oxoglutarate ferredoxin oxidoreductase subunit delta
VAKEKKTHQAVVKTEFCKGCNFCVEVCKPEVLRPSAHLNKMGYNYVEAVDDRECNGCMVCTLVCPDLVIEVYYE